MDLANDFCDDVFCDGLSDYCATSYTEERYVNMPLKNLPTLIKRLRGHITFDRYRDVLRQSEALTRYTLIDPFLRELGWNTEDPALVRPEYRTGAYGSSADYALFSNGEPVIMLEAKSLDTPLRCAVKQVIKHCKRTRTKYAVVTDGRHWKIYEAQQTGEIEENKKSSFDPESPSVEFDLKSLSAMDECREVWKSLHLDNTPLVSSLIRRVAYILREILIIPDLLNMLDASLNTSARTQPNLKSVPPDHSGVHPCLLFTIYMGCCTTDCGPINPEF